MSLCNSFGWTNFLLVNNLIPYSSPETAECFYVSWYLAVDFQLYLVAPIFFLPSLKDKRFGACLVAASCLLSTVAGFTGFDRFVAL